MIDPALFTEEVEVKRLGTVSGNKQAYSTEIAALACHIQPFADRNSGDIEGGFGRDYRLFCDKADIREADRVIWNGTEYRVVGATSHTFMGHEHTEAIIRAFKSDVQVGLV